VYSDVSTLPVSRYVFSSRVLAFGS
jgi:hypothetical protein